MLRKHEPAVMVRVRKSTHDIARKIATKTGQDMIDIYAESIKEKALNVLK